MNEGHSPQSPWHQTFSCPKVCIISGFRAVKEKEKLEGDAKCTAGLEGLVKGKPRVSWVCRLPHIWTPFQPT